MPETTFPAPGASSGIQWNTYTLTTTASSSGTTVTITGTTDSRWVGTTPVVNSGTGQFATNTIITSVINTTSFKVNITPTVALSTASITISNSSINNITDNRLLGKTKDSFLAKGPGSRNLILNGKTKDSFLVKDIPGFDYKFDVNNVVKFKSISSNPIPNDALAYDVNNLQKPIQIMRGIPGADYKFDVNTLQKPIQIMRGIPGADYKFDVNNVVKFKSISSNPIPNDALAYDVNNLQKPIQIMRGIPGADYKFDVNTLQKPIQIMRGIPGADYKFDVNNIGKLKVPYTNIQIFFTPFLSSIKPGIIARGTTSRNIILSNNLQKQIEVIKSSGNTPANNNIDSIVLQSSVVINTTPLLPRERLYYAQIAQGRYGVRFPFDFIAGMLAVRPPSSLQKQIEVIKSSGNTPANNNIDSLILQRNVSTNTNPLLPRERLYYAQIAQGRYGVRFPFDFIAGIPGADYKFDVNNIKQFKTISINPASFDNLYYDVNNLQKPIQIMRGIPGADYKFDVNNIKQFKTISINPASFDNLYYDTNNVRSTVALNNPTPIDNLYYDTNNVRSTVALNNPTPIDILYFYTTNLENSKDKIRRAGADFISSVNIIDKFKVPYNKTKVFYTEPLGSLQKPIEIVKTVGNRSYHTLISYVEKLKINSNSTSVFDAARYGSIVRLKTSKVADPSAYNTYNTSSPVAPIQFWN